MLLIVKPPADCDAGGFFTLTTPRGAGHMIETIEGVLNFISRVCIFAASVMLPGPAQKVVMIAIDVILAVFGFIMLLAGMELMQFGWATLLPMLDIPESFRTLAITSCGALVCLFAGTRAIVRSLAFCDDWHLYVPAQEQ